jgi:chromosome segregation protein
MHLKSITLKGFKSFPDRTRLEFGPGVSVVVGPNGSGKSNITDAVLWALGEQSAAAVRGSSMQDVIFAGSPGRQAATSAEVELVLDDSGGLLGLGRPEVSIVRRLDRGGEGEYRLAGARCRLVDVIEVLSDTGLGKEMHSVISQGRVESLVTSKPRDRRLLIEEAAGLGKHRKRRRRAQLKLERTQQNLDRALDVEREARSRLRPLKRQAEAAELHQRLERQSLEARWELAGDDLRRWRGELESAEILVGEARGRRGAVEHELEAVAARREGAEEALAARSARREELSRRLFKAQSASEGVAYRAEALAAAQTTVQDRVRQSRALLEAFRSEAAEEEGEEQPLALIAALEEELQALERDRDAEIASQVDQLERQRTDAERLLAERAEACARSRHERQQAEGRVEQAREQLREAERAVEAARREAAKVGGELASVNQFLRSHTRLVSGAAALADRLEVDPGYEMALAAALDGRLGAALAADRGEAQTLLDGAGEAGGRVLVAGPSDSERREAPPPPSAAAEPLSSHVRGHDDAAAVARDLLRETWVVDDVEGLPQGFEGVAVTRSGRVWVSRTRELRQAPALGEDRVLAERNRREQLIRESEAAAQAELSAQAAVERNAELVSEREAERESAVAADRAAVRERDEVAEEEQRLRGLIERRREAPDEGPRAARRAQLTAELDAERRMVERFRRERSQRERRIELLGEAIERDESLLPEIGRLIASLKAVGEAIDQQRQRFEQALEADREAGEKVSLELRSCAQQEAGLQGRLHAENEALTQVEIQAQRARDQASDVEKELTALSERLGLDPQPPAEELKQEQRDALQQRIERLARRREQIGPVNPLAQQEYRDAVEHVEELERQRQDLETALRELEKLIRDTDRQIRESFERTFAAAAQNFEDVVEKLFPGGRGRLRLVHARDEAPARTLGAQDAETDESEAGDGEAEEQPATDEDDGVEIEITPAGKEMKRLSLLSGGEKSMTALAFLFAVFLARPCPFYILDEVEAALDDLNIDRFLDLLRSYSERAQFIVVTHQKRTMEAADSLYGVSMGSDGISKVISRRLPVEQAA